MPRDNTSTAKFFKMAERSDSCSGEILLDPCTRKKRQQGKMTQDHYWIGAQENIVLHHTYINLGHGLIWLLS